MAHDALLGLVDVLERIRDDDYLCFDVLVVRVDDGIEGRAFARAGDAGDQGESVAQVPEHQSAFDQWVKTERPQRPWLPRQHTLAEGEVLVVEEDGGTEAAYVPVAGDFESGPVVDGEGR